MIDFEKLEPEPISHWQFRGSFEFEVPLGAFGFVYKISMIDPIPGQPSIYIGRKYLSRSKTSSKRVTLKTGAKVTKKKKSRVESDWRVYTGSCQELNAVMDKLGKEAFKFEIICFCPTKGTVNFAEEFVQMQAKVMINDDYFNNAVGSGSFRGVKFSDEFKTILKEIQI